MAETTLHHGCPACGGTLAVRFTLAGARTVCGQCLSFDRPLLVMGPQGPRFAFHPRAQA